ncbi:MAG: hypothetical protein JJ908_12495 [Rhizobiales bacterium]|nr:hypothetical protein [Hyphomicrobiales bacterium]MBO6699645.1 hypothetical protein [Hyphomicrobiales bacterium]MBO6737183.1 hypothetical protein [Hyphomicrobiales bacterium]MBO6911743.1 hypothetical protein [Hyphomicrobiales bacterium]MBO6954680.1 hypothetical protein [Hyphomicrobiales bacterium]
MTDKKASKSFGHASTPIATQARLDALKAARPKPTVERHLTPGGDLEIQSKQAVNRSLERDISQTASRLENARHRLNEGRAKTWAKGKAKARFERSR